MLSDHFCVSAPPSPSRFNLDKNLCFYSVPASPSRGMLKATFDLETEHTVPKSYEDVNSIVLDDFEFETSRRFNIEDHDFEISQRSNDTMEHQQEEQQNHQRQFKASLPAMAFADELFRGGMVRPLELPPRLQYANNNKLGSHASTPTSPRSPTSIFKLPFSRQSLWNDDFDPFMVALENVKEEKEGNYQGSNHKPPWSMSLLGVNSDGQPNVLMGCNNEDCKQWDSGMPNLNKQVMLNGSDSFSPVPSLDRDMDPPQQKKAVPASPMNPAEPKGVLFARQIRLVKPGNTTLQEPMVDGAEKAKEGGRSWTSTREKIKNFLLRISSMTRTGDEHKRKYQKVKPKLIKKPSFRSEKWVSEVTKMRLVKYRPKLPTCVQCKVNDRYGLQRF